MLVENLMTIIKYQRTRTDNTSFLNRKKNINFRKNDFLISENTSEGTLEYLKSHCSISSSRTEIVSTDNLLNVKAENDVNCIVNLHRVNNIRFINKFFEGINKKLSNEDTFICCVETFTARKNRKRINRIPLIRNVYFGFEFVFMRVFPKVKFLRTFYFTITRGKNRLLSKAETLGRLVCCGFDVVNYKTIDGLIYIVAKKKSIPTYDMNPSYGPIYKMPRIGKSKKIIYVYKLRTMHPYSEYLQKYVFEKNGTSNGDKVNDDFRISPLGSFFRKVWIDELPMLINLVKGDLKIVGVRPLSIEKFNMYPEEIQDLRTKVKPGLIPPFYADIPNNFDELVESETKYLNKHLEQPLFTDIKYFYKAFVNILFKGARSK
jgi:lipopolysaccharide/colanic/teichoic acid biosynthesis glycosyltransferase